MEVLIMEDGGKVVPVELAAGGLLLRPWDDGDFEPALRGVCDAEFQRWNLAHGPEPTEAGARAFLESRAEGWARGDNLSFAVTDVASGVVLGNVGVGRVNAVHRSGVVGYWLLPEARGRGVATVAVEAMTRWAFGAPLGLHRLELGHDVRNAPSCGVAVRCGFLAEGVLRGYLVDRAGCPTDVHLHARLATDPVGG